MIGAQDHAGVKPVKNERRNSRSMAKLHVAVLDEEEDAINGMIEEEMQRLP